MEATMRSARVSSVWLMDGLVVFWLVLWIVIGAWVGYSVWGLSEVGETIATTGATLDSAGQALQRLGDVPIVGDQSREFGDQVRANAAEVVSNGRQTEANLRQLAVLLGVAVAVFPTAPALLSYVPARLGRRRDVRAVRRALNSPEHHDGLGAYLAYRALATIPLADLMQISGQPYRELGRLADAELARMGVSPPVTPPDPDA